MSVNNMIAKIKREGDYDIVDSDLDTLIMGWIDNIHRVLKQLLMDYNLLDEISVEGSFSTTALQEYVDIGTEITDLDEIICQSERTNDRTIQLIPFALYRKLYPDPSATSSATPDVAARHYNRIYFGPTPSTALTIYFDYIKLISDVAAGGTLPFEGKYDPIIAASCIRDLKGYLGDTNGWEMFRDTLDKLTDTLIVSAAKNIGMSRGSLSRRGICGHGPQTTDDLPTYGFGVGGFGARGFGA